MNKITPVERTHKNKRTAYDLMTPAERIEHIKKIRDMYPEDHQQIAAINLQIKNLESRL